MRENVSALEDRVVETQRSEEHLAGSELLAVYPPRVSIAILQRPCMHASTPAQTFFWGTVL